MADEQINNGIGVVPDISTPGDYKLNMDINGLTTAGSLDANNDQVAIYDSSAGGVRKIAASAFGGATTNSTTITVDAGGGGDYTSITAALNSPQRRFYK